MTVIIFDPGVSTGAAVLEDDGTVVDSWTLHEVGEVERKVRHLHGAYPDADVVVEQPPLLGGNYRPHTQQIEAAISGAFSEITWVSPGQWKGHPAARSDSSMRGKTQHEKDAVSLGRWFLRYRRSISAGPK